MSRGCCQVQCDFLDSIRAGSRRVVANAQDAQGPLTPTPAEGMMCGGWGRSRSSAPPSLPPDEKSFVGFSAKEDQFIAARPNYGYRKTIRIDEFGEDGKPAGQFLIGDGGDPGGEWASINKVVQKPQSTLHYFNLESEDVRELDRIPLFADDEPACEI